MGHPVATRESMQLRLESAVQTAKELVHMSSPKVVHETLSCLVAGRGLQCGTAAARQCNAVSQSHWMFCMGLATTRYRVRQTLADSARDCVGAQALTFCVTFWDSFASEPLFQRQIGKPFAAAMLQADERPHVPSLELTAPPMRPASVAGSYGRFAMHMATAAEVIDSLSPMIRALGSSVA